MAQTVVHMSHSMPHTWSQEVRRCHTRGESEESIARRWQSMSARDPPWLWNPGQFIRDPQKGLLKRWIPSDKNVLIVRSLFLKIHKLLNWITTTFLLKSTIILKLLLHYRWKKPNQNCDWLNLAVERTNHLLVNSGKISTMLSQVMILICYFNIVFLECIFSWC